MASASASNWASVQNAEVYWYWQCLSNYYSYYLNYMWYSSYSRCQQVMPNVPDARQQQQQQQQSDRGGDVDRKALEKQWLEYFQQQWSHQQQSNYQQNTQQQPDAATVFQQRADDVIRHDRQTGLNLEYSFQRGYEVKPASVMRRILAAFIDLFVVSLLQYFVCVYVLEMPMRVPLAFTLMMPGNTLENIDESLLADFENLSFSVAVYFMIVLCYESIFHAGVAHVGGATPGKRLMGLTVMRCETTHVLANGNVAVFPGGPLGPTRSSIRAVFKNMSSMLLLPMFITMFVTKSRRTAYDVMSGSIVVVQPLTVIQEQQQRQQLR